MAYLDHLCLSVNDYFPLLSLVPIDNTLLCDFGTLIGVCHIRGVRAVRSGIWAVPISTARLACGARKVAAWGRMVSKRSTARRVTMSNAGKSFPARCARVSARSVFTLMLVNVRARV